MQTIHGAFTDTPSNESIATAVPECLAAEESVGEVTKLHNVLDGLEERLQRRLSQFIFTPATVSLYVGVPHVCAADDNDAPPSAMSTMQPDYPDSFFC